MSVFFSWLSPPVRLPLLAEVLWCWSASSLICPSPPFLLLVFPLFILFLLSSVLSPFPQLANINACIMVERSICVVYIKHQLLALFHYHDGWKTCCSDQVANKAYALVCCLLMHSKTIQLRPQHSVWDLSVIRRLATCL